MHQDFCLLSTPLIEKKQYKQYENCGVFILFRTVGVEQSVQGQHCTVNGTDLAITCKRVHKVRLNVKLLFALTAEEKMSFYVCLI